MKRGAPLRRKSPLKPRRGLSPGRSRPGSAKPGESDAAREQRLRDAEALRRAAAKWKATVCHRKAVCAVCGRGPEPGNPLDAHHVTEKRTIKRYVSGLRLPEREEQEVLRRLLYDARNGMAVHKREHERHTNAVERIPLRCVTSKHRQFAAEVGAAHLIERYYAA